MFFKKDKYNIVRFTNKKGLDLTNNLYIAGMMCLAAGAVVEHFTSRTYLAPRDEDAAVITDLERAYRDASERED